jgi:hypothetical protein
MKTIFEENTQEFKSVFPSTPIDDVIKKSFATSKLVEKIDEAELTFWRKLRLEVRMMAHR